LSREEIAEKWLNKALADLRVAEKLFEIGEEPMDHSIPRITSR